MTSLVIFLFTVPLVVWQALGLKPAYSAALGAIIAFLLGLNLTKARFLSNSDEKLSLAVWYACRDFRRVRSGLHKPFAIALHSAREICNPRMLISPGDCMGRTNGRILLANSQCGADNEKCCVLPRFQKFQLIPPALPALRFLKVRHFSACATKWVFS